jgi:hypothetical protein
VNSIVIISAFVAAPLFLVLFFRAPAALVFFGLLVGQLLQSQLSDEATLVGTTFFKLGHSGLVPQLVLLGLPAVLTLLFLRKRVPKSKLVLQILPGALLGASTLLVVCALVPELSRAVEASKAGDQILGHKSFILLGASAISMLTVWFSYPKPHNEKEGKHHK